MCLQTSIIRSSSYLSDSRTVSQFRQRNLKFGQTTSVQRFIPLRCDFQIRSRNLNCLWRFSCPSLILAFQKYGNAHTQDFHRLLHADCTSIGREMFIIKSSGNRSKRSWISYFCVPRMQGAIRKGVNVMGYSEVKPWGIRVKFNQRTVFWRVTTLPPIIFLELLSLVIASRFDNRWK